MSASVRSPFLLLFAAIGLAVVPQSHSQTTVATDPVGYNTITLPAGTSLRVNTFVNAKAFQGVASSITSGTYSTINCSGSTATFTSGTYNQTGSQPAYFVEILSGSSTGLIADVVSNGTSSVTVAANLGSYGVSGTSSFCIRPHTTLSSLLPASTSGLTPYADAVKIFAPDSSSVLYLFTGSGSGWVNASTFADAGNAVIYPGQGVMFTVGSPESVTFYGSVKAGPTIVPLYANGFNIVGTLNPGVSGTQTLGNFNFPAAIAAYADGVKVFADNGFLSPSILYLSDGTNMLNSNTFATANSDAVPTSNAVIVTVSQSTMWTMPSFYTSGQ